MTTIDTGTYIEVDGRPAIRFVRAYAHSPERVWTAVSDPAGLAHWFPSTVRIEPRVGGTITFSDDPDADDATGTVLAYDPPRTLAFTWGGDEMHLTVEPSEAGCTLTLVNVLVARDTAARNAAGWAICLEELASHLSGGPGGGPGDSTECEAPPGWEPVYAAAVASGLPSGAPLPGVD